MAASEPKDEAESPKSRTRSPLTTPAARRWKNTTMKAAAMTPQIVHRALRAFSIFPPGLSKPNTPFRRITIVWHIDKKM